MGVLRDLKLWVGDLPKYFLPHYYPDFIIIGAQKAGTGFLHHYLSRHSDLQGSIPKEVHFFDRKIHRGYDYDWYKSHFVRKSFKRKMYFESTPKYVYHEEIPKFLIDINPGIKLILLLRDPVARAYSAWNMYKYLFMKQLPNVPDRKDGVYIYLFKDRSEFPSFREAIDLELKLIENNESPEPSLLRRGLYDQQIKNWLKYFDREQLLIMGYKELFSEMESSFKRITDFLGCVPLKINLNKTKPKNKGSYDSPLSGEDRAFLENYYSGVKPEVERLVRREINW